MTELFVYLDSMSYLEICGLLGLFYGSDWLIGNIMRIKCYTYNGKDT